MAINVAESANRFFHTTLASVLARVAREQHDPELAAKIIRICGDFQHAIQDCESPIEQLMAAGLLWIEQPSGKVRYCPRAQVEPLGGYERCAPETGTVFIPQAQYGGYRVDFLLVTSGGGRHALTAIECDGHDFHERTKEQAARDRNRDRRMTIDGVTVLRFTGSEIHRDLNGCLDQIETVLSQHAARLAATHESSEAAAAHG